MRKSSLRECECILHFPDAWLVVINFVSTCVLLVLFPTGVLRKASGVLLSVASDPVLRLGLVDAAHANERS